MLSQYNLWLAFHTAYSCIFHPCNFARIAFSTPAFSVASLSNFTLIGATWLRECGWMLEGPKAVSDMRKVRSAGSLMMGLGSNAPPEKNEFNVQIGYVFWCIWQAEKKTFSLPNIVVIAH